MEQLRIYTLVDKNTAEHYFKEHWPKHIKSLPKFGFELKEFGLVTQPTQKIR